VSEFRDRPVTGLAANRELNNRMPVVLKPEVSPEWLGEEHADTPRIKASLAPLI
jgi:hypothetical protein